MEIKNIKGRKIHNCFIFFLPFLGRLGGKRERVQREEETHKMEKEKVFICRLEENFENLIATFDSKYNNYKSLFLKS